MRKLDDKQKEAKKLRQQNWSLGKIAQKLNVAKSSVSVWVRDIEVSGISSDWEREKQEYLKKPSTCLHCNKNLPYKKRNNKFCSFSCNGKYHKPKRKKPNCLNCGNEVKYHQNKFCSIDCSVDFHWKERINKVNETGHFPPHQKTAKDICVKMRGHKCEICKTTEWMGQPVPLVLDHIDGDSENWKEDNLRLVCGNCDMQLPTYKSKNKGNGRRYDREYKRKRNK